MDPLAPQSYVYISSRPRGRPFLLPRLANLLAAPQGEEALMCATYASRQSLVMDTLNTVRYALTVNG